MADVHQFNYYLYDAALLPTTNFGFVSKGADCWCNSIVQLLLSLPALSRVLIEDENSFETNLFATAYIKLLKNTIQYYNPSSMVNNAAESRNILLALQLQNPIGRKDIARIQMCAEQMINTFIDAFNSGRVHKLFASTFDYSIKCCKCNRIKSRTMDRIMHHIMIENDCVHGNEEEFTNWVMARYTEMPDHHCDKCDNIGIGCRRIEIVKMLSEVIIIAFIKYNYKYYRWFPQTMTFPSKGGTKIHYRIVAKIEHSGDTDKGHYWTHALRHGQWKKFNDSTVSPGNSMPTDQTFIVAYHMDRVIPDGGR